jgi:replicative DNA helicase
MNAMATNQKIIQMPKAVPVNESSERCAISGLLQNFDLLNAMAWTEELFFSQAHKIILQAVRELHEAGVKTDFFAVQAKLEQNGVLGDIGGDHALMELRTTFPTGDPGSVAWHHAILVKTARYRRALESVRRAEENFSRQEGDIAALSLELATAAAQGETQRKSTRDILEQIVDYLENNEPAEAFSTGLGYLDEVTGGGLKRGELVTIAAPTSGGKSILLVQMALEAIKANKRVVFFSLEMPAAQVLSRILSAMCGFNIKALKYVGDDATNDKVAKFQRAMTTLKAAKIQVESGYSELETIDGALRELTAKGECDIAVVDYIQLVHLRSLSSNETREQHVSEITKRLKALALQLNIAVATASQLNDEGKLRESRAIGHHSDHVWMISHTDEGALITVNKNREGERGASIPAIMHGSTSQFVPRDKRVKK